MSEYKNISQRDYWNLHSWLRRNYGKATHCSNNCGTDAKVFDWALINGKKYERKVENYIMLCKKCHYIYDQRNINGPLHPMYGKKHREDSKVKMSKSRMGKKYALGFKHSDETRQKMSRSHKGVLKSEEHKKNIGLAHKGKKLSLERRKQLSEIRLKYWEEKRKNK